VLYTDGVTEAFDKDRNEFGEARFVALLERIGMAGAPRTWGGDSRARYRSSRATRRSPTTLPSSSSIEPEGRRVVRLRDFDYA
jgi:hypothetical protein